MTEFDPKNAIRIAADDIESLRKADVYRVLDSFPEHRDALAAYITEHRPDLKGEVDECLDEPQGSN
jgi:hypothetical protein